MIHVYHDAVNSPLTIALEIVVWLHVVGGVHSQRDATAGRARLPIHNKTRRCEQSHQQNRARDKSAAKRVAANH